ncbi:lysylphosphatidylglycerol synthase transmembrane domain-containing protein [Wenzhouxiangella sp. EGI_FJ10305]|uniref:lysylphosphatidylglycerol synthase transmembrane domain-containing protein n=1 Tax=Wenzhouxiangella sp. EGI_FJ10305 TaxID=3243768 RepID=UPI0035DA852C
MTERRWSWTLLRWTISLGVLAVLLWWLEPVSIATEMADLSATWLTAALAVTLVQMALSAWRWRFTAHRLGLSLSWPRALGDYYQAVFVNQVLPGGVAGDALRAHQHARDTGATGPAWRAVIIERASGQLVVALGTIIVLGLVPFWREAWAAAMPDGAAVWLATLLAALLLAVAFNLVARRWPRHWRVVRADVDSALLAPSAWPRQLAASMAIVFSYVVVFAFAGRAIGAGIDFALLLAVALPILLAMLIPLSVAGWGFREAAAAAVWMMLGLPAEQGVAVAMSYGLVNLAASLPGALPLMVRLR